MKKTIGVLGGMWPSASSVFYQKIIQYSQSHYWAVQDNDYPPVILYSLPLDGFDETGIRDEWEVKRQLIDAVKKLESSWCDFIVIACNTVHIFYEEMQKSIRIPIFNIVEKTWEEIIKRNISKIGLLASESTCTSWLYTSNFEHNWISVMLPNNKEQKIINSVIENVMWWNHGNKDINLLRKVIERYIDAGVQAIVLWCTELPLAISQKDVDITVFDAMDIIVQHSVYISLNDYHTNKNNFI
jgi:aspartate racemase